MRIEPKREFSAERVKRLRKGLAPDAQITNMQIFEAINDLRGELTAVKATVSAIRVTTAHPNHGPEAENDDSYHPEDVRVEIAQMVRMIGDTKREIAQLKHPSADSAGDQVAQATCELDETIVATERATNDILDANEKIEKIADELAQLLHDDPDVTQACEKITSHVITILEASNFQDITGQRMTKVINTLHFIEDRIMAMINIWGTDAFLDVPVEIDDRRTDEDNLMNGPALSGKAITQDDIDALFN